ncbi:glycoside hydrolase superfamily [Podospora fimiseda]|uniref:Glycoside hydrolase superfamily n=1 Tax=Podospora fimiseda TaxID=252190 RepID=A0AAN7GYW4_9PEZI|nr:glycoside hydrolase superfamily [Podospora fimiseda]
MDPSEEPWWKEATFYQIYPASFKDSNNDGWGDIPGITSKISYLSSLGIDAIWLSPIYDSPQNDMGYDISNYQSLYPPYGTLSDLDTLIKTCHSHNLKIIMDLVINHTSSLHPWFIESSSSKTNPKRDYYIWKPPRYSPSGDILPPTNWRSYFSSSTWTFSPQTQEYYLHLYHSSQPDLNWENPSLRKAIYEEAITFWLERGIDGFRIDTVNKYSKVQSFEDAPVTIPDSKHQPAPEYWCNGPRIHEFLHEMHTQVLDPYNAVSIGELSNTPFPEQVLPYVSAAKKELDMAHEFSIIRLGTGKNIFESKYDYTPFTLPTVKQLVEKWQVFTEGTDGWNTVFIENHDNGRCVSRFGDGSPQSAKCIGLWQATLSGTLFIYQGQEIGMGNIPGDWEWKEYKDVESKEALQEAGGNGDKEKVKRVEEGLRILARDHARVPMRWNEEENGGFTGVEANPWMRAFEKGVSVESQMGDENSVLEFYRRVLKMRREYKDLFVYGRFKLLFGEDEKLFVYIQEGEHRKGLVVMNFTGEEQILPDTEEILEGKGRLLIGTFGEDVISEYLKPWEGRVYVNF